MEIDKRDVNYYNGWIPFSKEVKYRGRALFWDRKDDNWFEGVLMDDSEYGVCVALHESYRTISGISFYFIVKNP